ncbi:MAG: hypothetical protein BACD_03014 [Bacteroides rodentium]
MSLNKSKNFSTYLTCIILIPSVYRKTALSNEQQTG